MLSPSPPPSTSARIRALRYSGLLEHSGLEQFGHLTDQVRDILEVPVAIVSLVDEDRQVFAGHSGLPEPWASLGQTPMSHSFCQHVVDSKAPLIVSDANDDPLLRDNLAINDLGVVAYLGVPIMLPGGELAGALAAIDTSPRIWTEVELRRLRSLARTVEKEIAIRLSEGHWRGLFDNMQEGFYVASALRDDAGALIDMLFQETNPAVGRITGIPASDFIGARLSVLMPDALPDLLAVYDRVLRTGQPELVETTHPTLGRSFDHRVRALDDRRIASVLMDVTERLQAEAALRISRAQLATVIDAMPVGVLLAEAPSGRVIMRNDRMTQILGQSPLGMGPGAGDAPFTAFDANGDPFDPLHSPLARIIAGEVQSHSVDVQLRRPDGLRTWIEIAGEAIRGDDDRLIAVCVVVSDIDERKKRDVEQRVLHSELAHRMKNSLAVVQSIVNQTLRQAPSIQEGRDAIVSRLAALSRAQDMLTQSHWDNSDIADVVDAATAPHRANADRITMQGPKVSLSAQQAMALSLAIHELATNAVKYGALSNDAGRVAICWHWQGRDFAFDWVESDGPPVAAPTRRGFGSRLIEQNVAAYFDGTGEIAYDPTGIRFRLTGTLDPQ